MQSNDSLLIEQYEKWKSMKELISKMYSEKNLSENELIVDSLLQIADSLERDLSFRSESFKAGSSKQQVTWEKIRDKLKWDEVAVEIIRFQHPLYYRTNHPAYYDSIRYAAVIIDNFSRWGPELVLFSDGYELENKFFPYYQNLFNSKLRTFIPMTPFGNLLKKS